MAYINTGLPNSGQTQYFEVTYESTLTTAQGLEVARELMNFCDKDYRLLVSWFQGATNMPGRLSAHVDNKTGGASWGDPFYNIYLGLGESVFGVSPATYARYLLISEVSEIFMLRRQFLPNYWFSASNEGNKGEALSCFLANELLGLIGSLSMPAVSSGTMAKASSWLDSSRANFLDRNDANIDPNVDPEISCGISFLNYLCHQRGIAIGDIIANGSDTFEGVFENLGLGSRSAAFPTFLAAVDDHYAQDSRLSTNPVLDNAFPAPELKEFVATPKVSWVPTGLVPSGRIFLSRRVPLDVLLIMTTDRPDLLKLPADRIVRTGSDDDTFSFSVKPQPATFVNANATITVEYAGEILNRLVTVYAPSAWPMPPLNIVSLMPIELCAEPFITGSKQSFIIENLSAFPRKAGLKIQWQVNNATGNTMSDGTFVIEMLPTAGTTVELTVIATNRDGVTAGGRLEFIVNPLKTGLAHELATFVCRIRNKFFLVIRILKLPIFVYRVRLEEVLGNINIQASEFFLRVAEFWRKLR